MVGLGHAEQVGDDQEGVRVGELAHELAFVVSRQQLVELAVGEAPHELLVLLEALRREQTHQQRAQIGVPRRVEGRAGRVPIGS